MISVISGANQFHPSQSVSWNPPPTHFPPPPISPPQSSSSSSVLNSAQAPSSLPDSISNIPQNSPQSSIVSSSQSNANQFNAQLVDSSNNQRTNSRSQSQSFSPSKPSESSVQSQPAYPFQYEDLQSNANKSRINFRPGNHNLLAPISEPPPPAPDSTPIPTRSTVPPSSTPAIANKTAPTNSSDNKKDDVVIYYYYYYDDDKNAKNDPNNELDAIPSLEGFDGGVNSQSQPPSSSHSQSTVGNPPGKILVKQPADSHKMMTDLHSGANVKPLDISAILNPSTSNSEHRKPTQPQQQSSSQPITSTSAQIQQPSQPSILPPITNHTSLVSNIFRYGNQQQSQPVTISTPQAPSQLPSHFEPEKIQPQFIGIEKLPEHDQPRISSPQIPASTAVPTLTSRTSTLQQYSTTTSARPRFTTTTTTTTTTTPTPSTTEASTTTESPRRRFGNRRPGFGAPNRSTPSYRNRLSTTTTTTTTTSAPPRTFTRAPPVSYNNPAAVNLRRNRPLSNNRFRRPQRPGFGSPINDERHSGDDQQGDGKEQNPSSTSTTTTTTTAAPHRTAQDQSSPSSRRFGNRGRYGGRGSYQPQPSTGRPSTEASSSTTDTATQSTTRRPSVYASRNRPQLRGGGGRLPFLRNRNRNQPEEQSAISSTTETTVAASVSAASDDQGNAGGNDETAAAAAIESGSQPASGNSDSDLESQPALGESSLSSTPSSSTERPKIGGGRQRPALFGNRPRPNLFGRRAPTPAQSA